MLYVVYLAQVNQFVPTEHLIEQIDSVIVDKITWKNSNKQITSKQQHKLLHLYKNILFPFNLKGWREVLKEQFPKLDKLTHFQLEESYFNLQVTNLYMIHFGRNPKLMYEDLHDFDTFLTKFNFIRFFYQYNISNHFQAQKYSERLIKSIKWRTQQSQQYLLMLIRAHKWQKFILHIQDFCICYETIYPNQCQQRQQEMIDK